MTKDLKWGHASPAEDFEASVPGRQERGEPPAIQLKKSEAGGIKPPPRSPAASVMPNRAEDMLQRVIERMEESDRRYGEALEDLHVRLDDLSRQAQTARAGEQEPGLQTVETQAASLAERLRSADAAHKSRREPGALSDIEQRISAFAEQIPAHDNTPDNDPYGDDFDQPGPPAAGAGPGTPSPAWGAGSDRTPTDRQGAAMDPLDQRFMDVGQRIEHSLATAPPARELETMRSQVDDLSQSFDAALSGTADADVLKSIEARLSGLSRYFDHAEEQRGRMESIESNLMQVVEMIQASGGPIEDAAHKAAQAAVRIYGDSNAASERLDAIQADLRALNERNQALDERTVDTLQAMNDTLKSLATRVGVGRETSRPGAAANTGPAFRAERGPVPPEFLDTGEERASSNGSSRTNDMTAAPQAAALPSDPTARASGRRSRLEADPPPVAESRGGEGNLANDDFIASARRAAQATSRQAEQSTGRLGRLRASTPFAGDGDDAVEGRRPRPLLVFAAVFLLVVSAALLYGRLKTKHDMPLASQHEQSSPAPERMMPQPNPPASDQSNSSAPSPAPSILERGSPPGPRGQLTRGVTEIARTPVSLRSDGATSAVPGTAVERGQPALPTLPASVPSPSPSDAAEAALPAQLRRAAEAGDRLAQFEIGERFSTGKGAPRDAARAARWFERAAAQGYAPAQFRLASLYERGQGVSRDLARAKVWYARAADQGNIYAMHNLAVIHSSQDGGTPDYALAAKRFTTAATHGLADSQFNLGILFAAGLGVAKDPVEAFKWFSLAAARGDKDAKKRAEQVRLQLSDQAVSETEAAVANWKPAAVDAEANGSGASQTLGRAGAGEPAASQAVLAAQKLLLALGYDVGTPDGLMGPRTETAIRLFEERIGMQPTGRTSTQLLARLRDRAS